MTLEQITHDLASIDRVVYRADLLPRGVHGWMLGGSGVDAAVTLVSFEVGQALPTSEQWAAKLASIKAKHKPSLIMAGAA